MMVGRIDPRAEWKQIFNDAWRIQRDFFYEQNMHGVDWEFYKESYARFLDELDTNWDFAELLSEMLGELNASHTGSGYRPRNPDADQTASLGFFPDADWTQDGIHVAEILDKGPLKQAGTKITTGTVIEAIDGHRIAAGENWYPLLNRKAGEPVRLALRNPDSGERWEERVKPIDTGQERQLLYERWVRTRREEVDRLSGGRIGYAHIRGMNDSSFRQIFEEMITVASGKRTKSEEFGYGDNEFVPWQIGAVM